WTRIDVNADAKLKSELIMALPESPYIDQKDGAVRIAGTRVGLASIVTHFQEHKTPEQIVDSFPTVRLAQAYGAIAFYLDNKDAIDEFFAEVDREFEQRVRPLSETDPALFARLEEPRRQMGLKRA